MRHTIDREIGLRACEEMSKRAGPMGKTKEARRLGIDRKNIYGWASMDCVPSVYCLQALAEGGYDVTYILTGRRTTTDEDNLLSEVSFMPGTPAGRSADVRCPFYKKNKASMISCEGITDDCSINLNFRNTPSCMQQMDIFCCDHYKRCEIYEAIMKAKYEDEL